MTVCTTKTIEFSRCKNRKVEVNFEGGEITSDAGVVLLSQADRKIKLIERIAGQITDNRCKGKVRHNIPAMIKQRVYGIALGYEDLNDHITLRKDIAFQTAVGQDEDLASNATLCRFENSADPDLFRVIHGDQVGRFFHGYYNNYCFLPLYVFCGKHLLAAYLRPSNIDPAHGAWGILKLLCKRFRAVWPKVKIIFRADSGFCRQLMMNWCDKNRVHYIIGIARNSRLEEQAKPLMAKAKAEFARDGEKKRLFSDFQYAADTWRYQRRIIVKAEHTAKGPNPRFIVTNLKTASQYLYDKVYCARGEAENRIKAQQLDLFADRTSCMNFLPNQLRMLLSGLAYTLIEAIRRLSLQSTDLYSASCTTIRLKLFKIGAVVLRNTRRIRLMLSTACPFRSVFYSSARRLGAT